MYLIVGLGNPGREYEHTHHNMGFDVVDKFADSLGVAFDRTDFKGLYVKARYMDNDLIILKPQTYMNLSFKPKDLTFGDIKIKFIIKFSIAAIMVLVAMILVLL